MKRERKFYTEHKKHIDELEAMLEMNVENEDEAETEGFMGKIARVNERLQLTPNPEKIEKFSKLAKWAEVMAEMLFFDIGIETNEKFGRTEFSSPDMMAPAPVGPKAKKYLLG